MNYNFKNLVFEGGGVKGIAYVGALQELEKKNILQNIKRIGGASAGAIMAVLVGLKYTPEEIKDILWEMDFNNFLDDSWGLIRDTNRLIHEFGWYKGDFFRTFIGNIIKKKTENSESTFADIKDLGFLDLYFIGTNLSTHFSEIFSFEHTPKMCVADACRISMSIPLFFAAKRSVRGDVYVDGGMLINYPIKLFDFEKYKECDFPSTTPEYYSEHNELPTTKEKMFFNTETLGFRVDSNKEISVFRDHSEPEHHKIDDFFSYAWELISTLIDSEHNIHLHSDDWKRTVYIDSLGVSTVDFNLKDEIKQKLIVSGVDGINNYFNWYDLENNNNGATA
jgi:NTE family protein